MAKTPATSSNWKTIEQPKLKRGMTPQSKGKRIKHFLKGMAWILGIVLMIGCGWVSVQGYQFVARWVSAVGPSQPLSHVVFESDGVLSKNWLEKKLMLPWGTPLLSVDIHGLKEILEKESQIQSVVIERHFPSTLNIYLKELQPAAKILVREGLKSTLYLVSENGQVYLGEGYSKGHLNTLPFIEGVQLRKNPQGGFFPLEGFQALSDFLAQTKLYYPDLYRNWRGISCARFKGQPDALGAAIEVKTDNESVIVFSPQKPLDQLQRLEYILNYVAQNGKPLPKRIDLTLEDQAAVEFQKPSKTVASKKLK